MILFIQVLLHKSQLYIFPLRIHFNFYSIRHSYLRKQNDMCRYKVDYGMFRFCIGDSEHDWREGTEQYKFIEECLATVDRKNQPWLIFSAHRVLGYSSNQWYSMHGNSEEPMGREHLEKLWRKYKVDIAFWGHVHNYERTCPIYQVS